MLDNLVDIMETVLLTVVEIALAQVQLLQQLQHQPLQHQPLQQLPQQPLQQLPQQPLQHQQQLRLLRASVDLKGVRNNVVCHAEEFQAEANVWSVSIDSTYLK